MSKIFSPFADGSIVEPKDFEKIDGVKQVYEGKYLLMNENT